jgi:hypothetical protein
VLYDRFEQILDKERSRGRIGPPNNRPKPPAGAGGAGSK